MSSPRPPSLKDSSLMGVTEVRESFKDTDKKMQAQRKKEDRRRQEFDRQIKDFRKSLKKENELFMGKWGVLLESLRKGLLAKLLRDRGLDVTMTAQRVQGAFSYRNEDGKEYVRRCDLDLIAKSNKDIVAVEVNTTLYRRDVRRFIKILEHFGDYFNEYRKWKVYGAMAFFKHRGKVLSYGESEGLFMIKATGDSAYIVNGEDFKPRLFS